MKNLISCIFIVIALFALCAKGIYAKETDQSATLKSEVQTSGFDYRVENLRNFLTRFNSPLANYAGNFVATADQNGLDYRLVPSISGVESTFGKQIPSNSYNAYGWANGEYGFKSWPDSINVVTSTLKNEYVDKGAASIVKIARRYAPPSSSWAGKVKYFVGKIDPLPLNFDII